MQPMRNESLRLIVGVQMEVGTLLAGLHGISGLCDGSSWCCITKCDTLSWFDLTRFCTTVRVGKQE